MKKVRTKAEAGSTIIVALLLLMIMSLLGVSLLFVTQVEMRSSRIYSDWMRTVADGDAGIDEILLRLNMIKGPAAPPTGSTVTVNALSDYDASLSYDPMKLLTNNKDDDVDGAFDEPDELNTTRTWTLRMSLTPNQINPGAPWQVTDTDLTVGPPFGNQVVVPTIQNANGWLRYTTATASDTDVLTLRYKLDTDLAVANVDGDGVEEVVFHDPNLVTDGIDAKTCLIGNGGDGNVNNDTPYNVTTIVAGKTYPATGSPVLLLNATARIQRGPKIVAHREVEAEIVAPIRRVLSNAICSCGGAKVVIENKRKAAYPYSISSYKSSDVTYGPGPASIGVNHELEIKDAIQISGNVVSTEKFKSSGDQSTIGGFLRSGGTLDFSKVTVTGTKTASVIPKPVPCDCGLIDLVPLAQAAEATNNNATAVKPNNVNPYISGTATVLTSRQIYDAVGNLSVHSAQTIILTGGTYFFDSIHIDGTGRIVIGVDADANGVVDGPPTPAVKIYTLGQLHLKGGGIINAYEPRHLQIYSAAGGGAGDRITIAGTYEFRGLIYAPFTNVELLGSNVYRGALMCKNVWIEIPNVAGARFYYDEDLRDVLVVRDPVEVIAWREIR